MEPIGGYFNLELNSQGGFLHDDGILVNSGRNAIELILRSLTDLKTLYVPYFTCDSILEPVLKLGLHTELYIINDNLELVNLPELKKGEYFLYTNYFGIKDKYCEILAEKYRTHLIIDNAQSFYSRHIKGVPTAFSPRKFVGIPDGGISYVSNPIDIKQQDKSYDRCSHLLKRYDLGASGGYNDYHVNSSKLHDQPIRKMSNLTELMLQSIDFQRIKEKRLENFTILHKVLAMTNKLKDINLEDISCPLLYPYWVNHGKSLRKYLISEQIYVATYWPNVFEWCKPNDLEYQLAENIVAIPIDQRYGIVEMNYIIDLIKRNE